MGRLQGEAERLLVRFGVRRLAVFGSAAREEAGETSDVDVLVEFAHPSFDTYMDLKFHLEDMLGRPVDLVMTHTLKPALRERVLEEARYVA